MNELSLSPKTTEKNYSSDSPSDPTGCATSGSRGWAPPCTRGLLPRRGTLLLPRTGTGILPPFGFLHPGCEGTPPVHPGQGGKQPEGERTDRPRGRRSERDGWRGEGETKGGERRCRIAGSHPPSKRHELHGACEWKRDACAATREGGRREKEGAKGDARDGTKWKMTFWLGPRRRRTQEAAAELTARRNTQDLWEQQQGRTDGNAGGDVRTSNGARGAPGRIGTDRTRHATTSATWSDTETRSETKQRMFQLTNRVSRFRRQVERLGTTKDTVQLRQKIKEDRESISEEAKELAEVLKQSNRETSASATRSERAAQERLLEDLKGVLRDFQEAQLTRVHKESSTVPVDEENSSNLSTWYEGQDDPREQDDPMHQDLEEQALLQQQQKARKEELDSQIRHNETIIHERDRGIQEIQNEIGEVNEIFADLAVLVQQQGGMIDDIEANVVSAAGRTGEAVVELRKAERNQRKSRGRLCIVMLIFGLVLLLVIIVAHR